MHDPSGLPRFQSKGSSHTRQGSEKKGESNEGKLEERKETARAGQTERKYGFPLKVFTGHKSRRGRPGLFSPSSVTRPARCTKATLFANKT